MLYVYSESVEQQRQLEAQFLTINSYFLIPSKQSYFLAEMLTSISHQFFQNAIPPFVEKLKEMLLQSFNSTYSLAGYRELMRLLKKQQQSNQMYREHLLEMNRAFAEDQADLDIAPEQNCDDFDDSLFEQALKGESHQPQNLEQFQLPLMSELDLKYESSDSKTEKTMQSDLCWSKCAERDIQKISGFGISRFDQVFGGSTADFGDNSFESWKQQPKPSPQKKEPEDEGSREMNSFSRKGSRIYNSNKNLKEIVVSEIRYDLNRQSKIGSTIYDKFQEEPQKKSYQKKIRESLMNFKLKLRRK